MLKPHKQYTQSDKLWYTDHGYEEGPLQSGTFLAYHDNGLLLRLYGGEKGGQKIIFASQAVTEWSCCQCGKMVSLSYHYGHWLDEQPLCAACWRKIPYTQTYTDLHLSCIDEERHHRTCDYWYLLSSGALSHTAFADAEEMLMWLNQRGLWLTDALPAERGTVKHIGIGGSYRESSYLDVAVFQAIQPTRDQFFLKIAVLDNARWTLGKVTQDEDGIRTVHHLNCNVKERTEFSSETMREPRYELLIQSAPDSTPYEIVELKRCPWCERQMPAQGFALSRLLKSEQEESVCEECQRTVEELERNEGANAPQEAMVKKEEESGL
jgi:hypothetical protein